MKTLEVDKMPITIPLTEEHGLSESEWDRLFSMLPKVPISGMDFDGKNRVYPCRVPVSPKWVSLPDGMVSLLLVMDSQRVSLIVRADGEIHKRYMEHGGGYLYVVGVLKSKQKDKSLYFNLYCRDVLFVSEKKGKGSSGNSRKR